MKGGIARTIWKDDDCALSRTKDSDCQKGDEETTPKRWFQFVPSIEGVGGPWERLLLEAFASRSDRFSLPVDLVGRLYFGDHCSSAEGP